MDPLRECLADVLQKALSDLLDPCCGRVLLTPPNWSCGHITHGALIL